MNHWQFDFVVGALFLIGAHLDLLSLDKRLDDYRANGGPSGIQLTGACLTCLWALVFVVLGYYLTIRSAIHIWL